MRCDGGEQEARVWSFGTHYISRNRTQPPISPLHPDHPPLLVLPMHPRNRWDSGETYLIADRCVSKLVEALSRGLSVRTGCPVERVEYGGPEFGVRLHCAGGRKIRCKRVIVTVPLRVLQVGAGADLRMSGQGDQGWCVGLVT